jgi:hypothetical protein
VIVIAHQGELKMALSNLTENNSIKTSFLVKGRNFIFSKLGECVHLVFRIVSNMAFEPGPSL